MRQVEQNPTGIRVVAQDGGDKRPVSSGDVDDSATCREVVRIGNGAAQRIRQSAHGLIEYAPSVRILSEVVEHAHSIDVVEGGLSGADAVEQVAPGAVLFLAVHDGERPHGAR